YPDIPRRVSGYNLNELLPENGFHVARALVGSECTLALTLEAKCRLVWNLPEGKGWLLVEYGGHTKEEADDKARRTMETLKQAGNAPSMKLYDDPKSAAKIWEVRESGLGATAWVPGQHVTWEGWEDSAVAPERLGGYLRELKALYDRHGYKGALYGHFGQGCVHTRITFDLYTAEGIANYRRFMDDATTLVTKYGGSLSGEHGDGQSKAEFLYKMFGEELI